MGIDSSLFRVGAVMLGLVVFGISSAAEREWTVGDLATVNQETLWYEAQAKLLKAKKQYTMDTQVESRSMDGAPEARGVQGVGSRLRVRFVFPSGAVTYGKQGDTLPGGYRVDSVTLEKVVISKAGETKAMGFTGAESAAAPAKDTRNSQPPAITLPLITGPQPGARP